MSETLLLLLRVSFLLATPLVGMQAGAENVFAAPDDYGPAQLTSLLENALSESFWAIGGRFPWRLDPVPTKLCESG